MLGADYFCLLGFCILSTSAAGKTAVSTGHLAWMLGQKDGICLLASRAWPLGWRPCLTALLQTGEGNEVLAEEASVGKRRLFPVVLLPPVSRYRCNTL